MSTLKKSEVGVPMSGRNWHITKVGGRYRLLIHSGKVSRVYFVKKYIHCIDIVQTLGIHLWDGKNF